MAFNRKENFKYSQTVQCSGYTSKGILKETQTHASKHCIRVI